MVYLVGYNYNTKKSQGKVPCIIQYKEESDYGSCNTTMLITSNTTTMVNLIQLQYKRSTRYGLPFIICNARHTRITTHVIQYYNTRNIMVLLHQIHIATF